MKPLIPFLFMFFFHINLIAQKISSEYLVRSTYSAAGSSKSILIDNSSYVIQQSIGQGSVISTFNESDYVIRQGFIQPNILSKIIDENVPLNLEVIIYPNPFVDSISLLFKEIINSDVTVQIYNMLGQSLSVKKFKNDQSIELFLYNLPLASYMLKVNANGKQQILKLVKK